jgi:hypothetical protein
MGSRMQSRGVQRGQVLVYTVLLLAMVMSIAIYGAIASPSRASQQIAKTLPALAQVKEALTGWSAARTPTGALPNARPGELPCPDLDSDGSEDGSCSAGAIGRVPWITLGIPEPKDEAGETLWYSVAGPFRIHNMSSAPITSNTLGNITVYAESSSTVLTSQAIAVIFAPGQSLGAQNRNPSTSALCSTTGTTIPRHRCATNYLEAVGGGNNAQTNGPFVQARPSDTFNDRLLVMTNADLMPAVEQRVAREMMALLQAYRSATGVYPWADWFNGNSNANLYSDAYNRSRFPCGTAEPVAWGSGGAPSLPNWLTNGCGSVSGWAGVIHYAVANDRLQGSGAGCTTCGGSLLNLTNSGTADLCLTSVSPFACNTTTVASGNADLILITPGAAATSPRGTWAQFDEEDPITGYFEDAQNSDNDDDDFVIPSVANANHDRIFVVR